jgi:hypothetical protein
MRKTFPYVLFMFFFLATQNQFAQLGGYVDEISVEKGDTIKFFISSDITPINIEIFRISDAAYYVTAFTNINASFQSTPDSSFWYGCNWDETFRFVIPDSWQPGFYRAEFPVKADSIVGVLFNVREKNPGTYSKILYVVSTNTWQAYNSYGGKSLYEYNSTNGQRSYKVSFHRPSEDRYGGGDFYRYAFKFISWAYKNNYDIEICCNYDLNKNPLLIDNYNVTIFTGHDEYWSRSERLSVQNFVKNGGRVIILSGNTSWWQVRFEENFSRMVCYKNSALDPFNGIIDSLVTVNWFDQPVNYPENILTGVSFRNGGYVNYNNYLPASEGYGDYAAVRTDHWIYEGTGLKDGEEFGHENTIVGYEVDGTKFIWQNGIAKPTGVDQTPVNFRILALSPAHNYNPNITGTHAVMGFYHKPQGGAVFNASTTDWCDGLETDFHVKRITVNVLDKFIENRFPPEIVQWNPSNPKLKIVNNDSLFINERNFLVLPGDSIQLSVIATDPDLAPVEYFWTVDDVVKGSGQNFKFINSSGITGPERFIVKAHSYNSQDTSAINWNLFNNELDIYSEPVLTVEPGKTYYYEPEVFNHYNDSLIYNLVAAPQWLSINQSGIISGTAPSDTGTFSVIITVENNHNQLDAQAYYLRVTDNIASVEGDNNPSAFNLEQNYPNPFNPVTTITWSTSNKMLNTLKVYDLLGREVKVLLTAELDPGNHKITFNAEGLASGVYFYQLQAGSFISTRKMILMK